MILIEQNQTSTDALPIEHFKAHLHLGSGFAEDTVQDQVLEGYLRAAISAIEGRTGQALYLRDFIWSTTSWDYEDRQACPIAPIRQIYTVSIITVDGAREDYDGAEFRIAEDSHFPELRRISGKLPVIPEEGKVEVRVNAGSATEWAQVPPDLAQAVLLMAAHYYEYRSDITLSRGCTPFGVTSLLERYRPIRLSLGGTR